MRDKRYSLYFHASLTHSDCQSPFGRRLYQLRIARMTNKWEAR